MENKESQVLDALHRVREKIWLESKEKSLDERVEYDNRECKEILEKWGIELKHADYLPKVDKR